MHKVINILADPDCEVIRPIVVDYNLIEVNEGKCWSVLEKRFLNNAIPAEGLVSPIAERQVCFTGADSPQQRSNCNQAKSVQQGNDWQEH